MRKVVYREWVRGIETEEYKQWKKAGDPPPIPQPYVDGTNCYIEKEGLFHGFFPVAMENYDGSFGNFTEGLIELEDGSMVNANPSLIRFVDSTEADQLAEFAKAAMQGLLENHMLIRSHSTEEIRSLISEHAILQAESLLAELKKTEIIMGKTMNYLQKQLKDPETKKDAEDCLEIYEKLKEMNNGSVWSSQWQLLVDVRFKGFPSDDRTYKPSKLGYVFLKGIDSK